MRPEENRLLALYDMGVIVASPNQKDLCMLASGRLATWSNPPRHFWKEVRDDVFWRPTRAGIAEARRISDKRRIR